MLGWPLGLVGFVVRDESDDLIYNKFNTMSIYSGFATRQQEHKYNNLIETLVIAMKKRIIKFYAGEPCD
jgi:hypothetical protein